jgi:hypothetical protein
MKLKRIYGTNFLTDDDFSHLDRDYLNEWGQPKSPERFTKLVRTLSSLAKSAIKRGQRYQETATHYMSDMKWLGEEIEKGAFGPSVG